MPKYDSIEWKKHNRRDFKRRSSSRDSWRSRSRDRKTYKKEDRTRHKRSHTSKEVYLWKRSKSRSPSPDHRRSKPDDTRKK